MREGEMHTSSLYGATRDGGSFERTWVGFPPPRDPRAEEAQAGAEPEATWVHGADAEREEPTSVDLAGTLAESGERLTYRNRSEQAILTIDMVEELRRRLRDAVALEAAASPSPDASTGRFASGPLFGCDELEEVLGILPELEVALAPKSDSNFYAGFDEQHPDGVFVATYARHPVGTPLYLTVELPAGLSFRTEAVVEWTRETDVSDPALPPGLGIRLCGLDARARELAKSYARHRKPLFWVG